MAATPALAAAGLDQSNEPVDAATNAFSSASNLAQTFTVGKTGTLAVVDLYMDPHGGQTTTVNIESVNSNMPSGTVLASGSAPVATIGWQEFTLTSPLAVTSGQQLAIVFTAPGGVYGSPDNYSGGQALMQFSSWETTDDAGLSCPDFAFKTFMTNIVASAPTSASSGGLVASTTGPGAKTTGTPSTGPEASSGNSTSSGTPASGGTTGPIVAGIVLVLAVVGGVAFLLIRRRRSADPRASD
jgi:hypothetical protein